MDGSFIDWGLGAPHAPPGVPSTPPGSTTNGILSTTITAINGNILTLADAATATVSNQSSLHDNVPAVLAGCAALGASGNGTLYIPVTNPPAIIPFNSPLDLYHSCNVNQVVIATGSSLSVNDPIVMRHAGTTIKGASPTSAVPSFGINFSTLVNGFGYPFVYFVPGSFGPNTLENLYFQPTQPYQSAFVEDSDAGGGAVVSTQYSNDYFVGNSGTMPGIIRGGFFKYFDKGVFSSNGAWGVPESLESTVPNSLGICAVCNSLAYIMKFDRVAFVGHGMEWDDWGLTTPGIAGYMTMNDVLMESAYMPLVTFNLRSSTATEIIMNGAIYADFLSGGATPFFQVGIGGVGSFVSRFSYCGNGSQPLFEGTIKGVEVMGGGSAGCSLLGTSTSIVTNLSGSNPTRQYNNVPVQASGTGQFYYLMTPPAAPGAAVSAGGAVPVGAHNYVIAAVDANGNLTTAGSATAITTTTGNQTVTITPASLPSGAVGYVTYRDGQKADYLGAGCLSYTAGSTPFVDISGTICGDSVPSSNTAATASLTQTGISAPQLKIVGGGLVDTLTGNFTANRTQTLADVSGIIPVTGYLNTAYDNFNRANGAIGGNWTATNGGFNVSGNTVVGTGGTNLAFWSANTFSNSQFAQVTVNTLNGATDFVGVDVLLSAGNNGYTCVENNASLLLQKLVAGTGTTLVSSATAGAPGDVLRLEAAPGGVLTCSRNGVTSITATDTTFTSGSPGIEQFGSAATMDNWSGGNLHPIGQLDIEQDWARTQHFPQGLAIGTEPLSASPRAEQNIFLPGALTSTWTASTWTTDKAITVTRIQVQAKTAPAACSPNAVVRLTDGTTPVNVTVSAAANDSGGIAQNYAAGSALQVQVQTAAAGCGTSPADANVVVQYRMQ
jgi:hypothetical protein